ncbi:PREDICTED: osmotin-like protein [Prunus mume]|uniref:Osmotin-like protein n=1 Tax=Prunus mume TaxID=102107 RepID=A0ABM0NG16_PRUMU|nr:PREDICTED: osmotin-like protein [Prunus mume]
MASSYHHKTLTLLLTTFLILCALAHATSPAPFLTLVNNCPFPLWPGIQPNSGHPVLERGGFYLPALSHRPFPTPTQPRPPGRRDGRLECNGAGGAAPATLAQVSLHHGPNDLFSYGVSLVDGFNVPLTITPHEGHGVCPVVGCKADLLATCPERLRVTSHAGVVACKSACEAFRTDELCCRNQYNSPQTCRASSYSEFFKRACPATFTFAHDSPTLMHQCSSPHELKVIFCH